MRKLIGAQCQTILWTIALLLSSAAARAEPAYWYQWESKFNGKMICKQLSPGEGWQQHAGPFYDARCTKEVLKTISTPRKPF